MDSSIVDRSRCGHKGIIMCLIPPEFDHDKIFLGMIKRYFSVGLGMIFPAHDLSLAFSNPKDLKNDFRDLKCHFDAIFF